MIEVNEKELKIVIGYSLDWNNEVEDHYNSIKDDVEYDYENNAEEFDEEELANRKKFLDYELTNEDKIAIHESCTNTILEFNSYTWDAKVSEKGEDKPIKQHDHAMDAVRYFCYTIIRKPNGISILK